MEFSQAKFRFISFNLVKILPCFYCYFW